MKILISADIEGVAGIDNYSQIRKVNSKNYAESCQLMTEEANAAIEACVEFGVDEIFIIDGHGIGKNLISDKLNPRAQRLDRKKYGMMEGVNKDIDAVIFIGYHGKASVLNSFTAHSYSSKLVSRILLNDIEVGEGELNSLVAKHFGAKTIFISGTDFSINELSISGIRSVVTKSSSLWDVAELKSIDIKKEIKKGVKDALSNVDSIGFIDYLPEKDINVEIEFNQAFVLEALEDVEISGRKTISYRAKNPSEAYLKAMHLIQLALKKYNRIYN